MITEQQANHLTDHIGKHFTTAWLYGHPIGGEEAGVFGMELRKGNWSRPEAERMIYTLRRKAYEIEQSLEA